MKSREGDSSASASKQNLEYLNGKFQGTIKQFSCENAGIFYWDDGCFYLGQWEKNKIHGKGIFVYPNGSYLYSSFYKDQLNGLTIMRLASGHLMIGNWVLNKKNGLFLYYDQEENLWLLCRHSQNKLDVNTELLHEEFVKGKDFYPKFLENFPALKQILQENIFQMLNEELKEKDSSFIYTKMKKEEIEYFGYSLNNIPHGLGILKRGHKIIGYGEFEEGSLNGLGRMFMDSQIFDGVFSKGILQGRGVNYNINEKNYIYGEFEKNLCKKLICSGNGFPKKIVAEYKRKLHKESKNFYERKFVSMIQRLFNYHQNLLNPVHKIPISDENFLNIATPTNNDNIEKKNNGQTPVKNFSKKQKFLSNKNETHGPKKSTTVLLSPNISPKKIKKNSFQVYPFLKSKEKNSFISIQNNKKVESIDNFADKNQLLNEEKTKKKSSSPPKKIEGINTSNILETKILVTPLKSKKVEKLDGFENQILYGIKTYALDSLQKEIIAENTEESRSSIVSVYANNLLQQFSIL